MPKDETQQDFLTSAEIRSEIEAFSEINQASLNKAADYLARDTGMDGDDLLHEAVKLSLEEDGGRKCPRGLGVVVFLKGAMRSIASHAREKYLREIPTDFINESENLAVDIKAQSPQPEDIAIAEIDYAKELSRVNEIFRGDSQAFAVIYGFGQGSTQNEVCQTAKMSKKEYDAARKRVRRALKRKFPGGFNA